MEGTLPDRDAEAGRRLWSAVSEAFGPGVANPYQLSRASGVSRPTLDGYWKGVQPTIGNMTRIAEALGLEPSYLWLRWLGIAVPRGVSGLSAQVARLAEAVEKMAAQDARLDEMEATLRALVVPTIATGAAPRAPRRTKG